MLSSSITRQCSSTPHVRETVELLRQRTPDFIAPESILVASKQSISQSCLLRHLDYHVASCKPEENPHHRRTEAAADWSLVRMRPRTVHCRHGLWLESGDPCRRRLKLVCEGRGSEGERRERRGGMGLGASTHWDFQKSALWYFTMLLYVPNKKLILDLGLRHADRNEIVCSQRPSEVVSAYGASIGDVIDDVTWLYVVKLVMSQSETRTRINYMCGPFKHTLS